MIDQRADSKVKTHRVFFAIVPDENSLNEIIALQSEQQADKARFLTPEKIHLTLLFIGSVDAERLACIIEKAAKASQRSFDISFDVTGSFKRSKILWLGSSKDNPNVNGLFKNLKHQIEQCGIKTEKRPFKPHITLARKFCGRQLIDPQHAIEFNVSHFYLMETIPNGNSVRYEILETYPLSD